MFKRLFGSSSSTLIESAFRDVASMLDQSALMYDHAVSAFLDNKELTVDLDRLDDEVDQSERMVRRSVLEHLSMNPGDQLVPSLILVSMVQDAERLGDFAKGFAQLAHMAQSPREGALRDILWGFAGRLRPMFELCRRAFVEDNVELAEKVVEEHKFLREALNQLMAKVAASDESANMAVVYALGAARLRRVSAHLANIASAVVQPYDRIRHGDEEV